MEAIIYGCGRLATMLTPHLVQSGHRVTVVDSDTECLESVVQEPQVRGVLVKDQMMQDYLQEGGIAVTELFLALSDDDQERPVNDTPASEHAFRWACQIGKHTKAELHAIYITEIPLEFPLNTEFVQEDNQGEHVLARVERKF